MIDAEKLMQPSQRRLIRVVIVDDHWLERFGLFSEQHLSRRAEAAAYIARGTQI